MGDQSSFTFPPVIKGVERISWGKSVTDTLKLQVLMYSKVLSSVVTSIDYLENLPCIILNF